MSHFLFASMGNDSIALIQAARDKSLGLIRGNDVRVVYTNTGWASEEWPERVRRGGELCAKYGFTFVELPSEGMEHMVRRKKGWPMPGSAMQFCTGELKIKPAMAYMDTVDPQREWTCMVGIRREESANRTTFPEWTESSDNHGGRSLWAPLVAHKEADRNTLITAAGFEILPHRSRECFPCIIGTRDTLRQLPESKLVQIETIEREMGFTKNNKPRTMFRPYRHMGATGIRAVKAWADSERGQYKSERMCDSGYCGT